MFRIVESFLDRNNNQHNDDDQLLAMDWKFIEKWIGVDDDDDFSRG